MKNFYTLIFFVGTSLCSFGQIVNNYTITVNDDTEALNATMENKTIVMKFQKTDILNITFSELEAKLTMKTLEIRSESDNNIIPLESFSKENISKDNSYIANISFGSLSNINSIYTLSIKDENGSQKLLQFKIQ